MFKSIIHLIKSTKKNSKEKKSSKNTKNNSANKGTEKSHAITHIFLFMDDGFSASDKKMRLCINLSRSG